MNVSQGNVTFESLSNAYDLLRDACLEIMANGPGQSVSIVNIALGVAEAAKRVSSDTVLTSSKPPVLDSDEFRDALRVYAENHGKIGEDAARYEVIQVAQEWADNRGCVRFT